MGPGFISIPPIMIENRQGRRRIENRMIDVVEVKRESELVRGKFENLLSDIRIVLWMFYS